MIKALAPPSAVPELVLEEKNTLNWVALSMLTSLTAKLSSEVDEEYGETIIEYIVVKLMYPAPKVTVVKPVPVNDSHLKSIPDGSIVHPALLETGTD
jgi:hypothetical protein